MDIVYDPCLKWGLCGESLDLCWILMKLLNFESLISQQAQEFVADLFQYWSMDTLIVCRPNGTIRNI